MGGITSYIYSCFDGDNKNDNDETLSKNNNNDSSFKKDVSRPKLKLKYSKNLPKEILSVNNMSIFPCQKLALIVNDNNELYILDKKFKFLIKKENNEKNICIKDDNLFLTYGENILSIWYINFENEVQLSKKDVININDGKIIQISFNNNDIIGLLSKNDEYTKIFKYSESIDKTYKEFASLISKEIIFGFLLLKDNHKDLIIISQQLGLKIYKINKHNFQLNTFIEHPYYMINIIDNISLFNYTSNIIAVIIKHGEVTSDHEPDPLLFYDKKTMKMISKRCIYAYFRNNDDVSFFYKKKLYLYTFYSDTIAGLIRENNVMNIRMHLDLNYKFIKLNENEICVYSKNEGGGKLCIYEFE